MGQIVSSAAKPKRCNANQLSQVPTPAAGEYILVSSDNSMNAAGQGNFDAYVVGDGTTAATALPLIKTYANDMDEEPTAGSKNLVKSGGVKNSVDTLRRDTLGTINVYNWWQGNIGTSGKFSANNIRVTTADVINVGSDVRIVCTGDVRINATIKYKSGKSPVDGGIANTDFVVYNLPSSGSRTDYIHEYDSSFPNLYVTFARVSNSSANITPEEVAANVQFINQGSSNVVLSKQIETVSNRVTAAEVTLNNTKSTPIASSTDLITSGGVEATLFHHYGTKDLVTNISGQQSILLREFDYGTYMAARIVSNSADLGSATIFFTGRQNDNTSIQKVLSSDWEVMNADSGKTFNRVAILSSGSITTAGTIKVEVIFKDAFDAIIRDNKPYAQSDLPVTSKGIFPYAQSAFQHRCGKNLCNPKDPAFEIGILLHNGVRKVNASFGTTGYIPVSQNGLVLNKNYYSAAYGHAIFDENYQYLRTVLSDTYTYVSGDAYVRFIFRASDKDEIQVEEGTTVTAFEEYNPVYGQINEVRNELKEWSDVRFAKKPVSPNDIPFLHLYNLFNKDTGQNYVNGETTVAIDDNIWGCRLYDNALVPNNNLSVTAYLPINGQKFYAHKIGGNQIFYVGYYDENKNYLSQYVAASTDEVFTPPANAKYVRVTFYTSNKSDFMVTHDLAPFVYVPYGKYLVDDIFWEDKKLPSEIVLPRNTYVIDGEQNSLYHSAYMDVYNPMVAYLDGASGNWGNYERCFRVEANKSAGNLSFKLRDRKTHEELQSITATVKKGLKTNTTNAVKINVIGDSFCYGGHYLKQMSDMCDNAQFIGMRASQYYQDLKCEGRGGWQLSSYFSPKSGDIALNHMQPFSPFMHAQGYNYYGVMEFWASIVNGTSQYAYGTNGFTDYVSWFDTDGRKANPAENDLVYNQTAGKFEYYNGSAWVQLATDPEFEFNYAEYIRIWQIDTPDFVVFELGTNDFYNNLITFADWSAMMDEAIASIKSYAAAESATIKILICTAWTITGLPNDLLQNNVIKRNHWLWTKRKELIAYYDTQAMENNGIYVVDTGIVVDDKYGFLLQEKKPFDYYEGSYKELYDSNGVHPDIAGYKQFGNCIAGAIQYLRT